MATVYKRGATWWVRFRWRDTEIRRSAHTSSKAVAQQMLARLLEEHRCLDRGGRRRRTYREALDRFSSDYMPSTQDRYRTSFRQLAGTFREFYLDEITRSRLADYAIAGSKGGMEGDDRLARLPVLMHCGLGLDWH